MERGLFVKISYVFSVAQLFALITGFFFGLLAQTPFFVIKQCTLLVERDSTAVKAICWQPALFKGKQVQGGNTAKYQ